jgi:PAS domain S-box-containing protein
MLPLHAEVAMKDSKTIPRKRSSPIRRKNKLPAPPLGKVKSIQPEDLSPYFDSPIDLLCIGSLEGIFQKLNPEWEATLGYPLSEMEGKDFIKFVHPDDRPETLAAFREFDRQKGVRVLTNRVRCKDGSFRWLEWKYLLRGKHIYAAARDITDRKRTEDELRESRRMLETVLNTIPARVFWKDRDLVYLGCNQSFAQDAGFRSPEEVIGKNDYQIGWADYTEEYQTDDRAVIETGRAKIDYEESAINAEGKHFWVSTSKIPLRDPEGGIRGVLGTYEDISERKQAEEEIRLLNVDLEQRVAVRTRQLEAANKELEAFSFSVSHDLRAPLRAIDGFTRILEEDYGKSLDKEGRRLCTFVRENTRHMNELIDDLLALSRLTRSEMEFLSNDIETMARSVFQELTTPESRTRIDLIIHHLPRAMGDPILLRQALTNIISNAIKFSSKRERARIEIGCQSSPEEDVFSVWDNGAGFDMHYVDRLFGVFQRLHSTAEFEGTGVGLAIVQRVIRRHGGRVWAEGAVDNGATFYFTLPKNAPGLNSSAGN